MSDQQLKEMLLEEVIQDFSSEKKAKLAETGAWIWTKGERDNYWIGPKRLKSGIYPYVKLNLTDKIKAYIQGNFTYIINDTSDEKYFDMHKAYFEFHEFAGLPLKATLGRQRITTGRAFLLGAWEKSYDAVRLNYAHGNGIYVDTFLASRDNDFHDFHADLSENRDNVVIARNEDDFHKNLAAFILGYRNDKTNIEGYVIHKTGGNPFLESTSLGLRAARAFDHGVSLNSEFVWQDSVERVLNGGGYSPGVFGTFDRRGYGGYIQLKKKFVDMPWTPELRTEYGYLSQNFDIIDGDLLYSDIKWGRVGGPRRNRHVFHAGATLQPLERLTLGVYGSYFRRVNKEFDWQPYNPVPAWWDSAWGDPVYWGVQNSNSKDHGYELDLEAVYKFGKNKEHSLSANFGQFWPGSAHDTYQPNAQKRRYLMEIGMNLNF